MLLVFIALGFCVGLCIGNWIDWFTELDSLKMFGIPMLLSIIAYVCIWLFCSETAIVVAMIGATAFTFLSIIVRQFKD